MLFWVVMVFMQLQIAFGYNITICSKFKCPDLSHYNITCKFVENNIDCLRSINKNEAQLGYASAYEAIPATKLLPNLEILGVVKNSGDSPQWKYEMVVVTNKPVANFGELKNFTYCNYGIGSYERPKYILDGLEREILKRYSSPNCGNKNTYDEEQVCNLNEFFGPSCRAGEWIYKIGADTTNSDYPKLCQLCPGNNCDIGYQPDLCLQSQRGAIVVTTLFNATLLKNPNLYYLCQNGSTSSEPCVWHKQSWPLIFTHKSSKPSISTKLNEILSICAIKGKRLCLYSLSEILTKTPAPYISVLNDTQSLLPTLQAYKLDSNRNKLRWCTVSKLEYEKCNWLKVFSGILIYPIDCILRDTKSSCISAIENHEADMVEIIRTPISASLKPIAISKKSYSLYLDIPDHHNSICKEVYYLKNSVLKLRSKIGLVCSLGLRYQIICTNQDMHLCYYHSEVIMRNDDPNRENAKVLLDDLLVIFNEISDELPFDLFGRFNGVPNLLLQYVTTDFYYINSNEKAEDDQDDFLDFPAKEIPKWPPQPVTKKPYWDRPVPEPDWIYTDRRPLPKWVNTDTQSYPKVTRADGESNGSTTETKSMIGFTIFLKIVVVLMVLFCLCCICTAGSIGGSCNSGSSGGSGGYGRSRGYGGSGGFEFDFDD